MIRSADIYDNQSKTDSIKANQNNRILCRKVAFYQHFQGLFWSFRCYLSTHTKLLATFGAMGISTKGTPNETIQGYLALLALFDNRTKNFFWKKSWPIT